MKIKLFSIILSFLIFSCSKNDDAELVVDDLKVNFNFPSTSIKVGDEIQITDLTISKNGIDSYLYNFGNSTFSAEQNPKIYYSSPGTFSIKLEVKDKLGKIKSISKQVVVERFTDFLKVPFDLGDRSYPIDINFKSNKLSFVESSRKFDANNGFYKYTSYDEINKTFSSKFFADNNYGSVNCTSTFLPNGNVIFNIRKSFQNIWTTKQVITNSNIESPIVSTNYDINLFGSIEESEKLLFFGSKNLNLYVQTRNLNGVITFEKSFIVNEIGNAFIGGMIKSGNNYIATGIKFVKSTTSNNISNCKPIFMIFNQNLDLISYKIYQESSISIADFYNLSVPTHIKSLPNGNFVIYCKNEIRIVNSIGGEITKRNVINYLLNYSLIVLNDSFLISRADFIDKYDLNGVLIKSISTPESSFASLLLIKSNNNDIYIAGGYERLDPLLGGNYSVWGTFVGKINENLQYIKP